MEPSVNRALPNYVKTPFGIMTEERAKQELGTMSQFKIQQAEALDLAQNINPRRKKRDYAV